MARGTERKMMRGAARACMLFVLACVLVCVTVASGANHERAEAGQVDSETTFEQDLQEAGAEGEQLALSSSAQTAHAQAAEGVVALSPIPRDASSYESGKLIVGLADGGVESACNMQDVCRAIEDAGCGVAEVLVEASEHSGSMILVETGADCQKGEGLQAAAEALAQIGGISYVQPNYRYTVNTRTGSAVQDQDAIENQYYLDSWASTYGANVEAAWDMLGESAENMVDVAVLDTGIYVMEDYNEDDSSYHQEFSARNLNMDAAVDIVHSGENGLLPLVNDQNPTGDDNGHGTHMAGIIAANAKTAATPDELPVGMAGVSPTARIVPVKVLDSAGQGSTDDIVRAYSYLIENDDLIDLRIINLSFALMVDQDEDGSGSDSVADIDSRALWTDLTHLHEATNVSDGDVHGDSALEQMIEEAEDYGVVTVCAVGNRKTGGAVYDSYPSAYERCVSVTAHDKNGCDAEYANNNGSEDISAPGTGIYSTWASQADAYATFDGTSQATAIVSGVLSMLWAKQPDLSVEDAKSALYETAKQHKVVSSSSSLSASASEEADVDAENAAIEVDASAGAGERASSSMFEVQTATTADGAKSKLDAAEGGSDMLIAGDAKLTSMAESSTDKQHYAVDAAAALDWVINEASS